MASWSKAVVYSGIAEVRQMRRRGERIKALSRRKLDSALYCRKSLKKQKKKRKRNDNCIWKPFKNVFN